MRWQLPLAAVAALLAVAAWLVTTSPFAPVLAGVALLSLAVAFRFPAMILLAFVIFSIFRIHEIVPVLIPLQIPFALSVLGLASVGWHLFLSGRIHSFLSPQLNVLLAFALVVSAGLLLAKSWSLAYSFWTENFLKLVFITVALSWAMRSRGDFKAATCIMALSGAFVGSVAIFNKLNGIGLVELTRVTVALDVGSPLGDPNILALALTLSLSFSLALLISREGVAEILLGLLGTATVIGAVVATQSRGGLLGVLAVLVVSATRVLKLRTSLLVLLPLVTAGLYMSMGLSERISGGMGDMSEASTEGRLLAWRAAVSMAYDRPLGVGLNNFISQFDAYADQWLQHPLTAHSIWFQVLGEIGFPGLFCFVLMVGITFTSAVRTQRLLHRNGEAEAIQSFACATVAGLAGYMVAGSFLSVAYDWYLYVLIAFSVALGRWPVRNEESVASRMSRTSAPAVSATPRPYAPGTFSQR